MAATSWWGHAAVREAGIEHQLVSYPGAGHAFFWPDTPAFSQQAPR